MTLTTSALTHIGVKAMGVSPKMPGTAPSQVTLVDGDPQRCLEQQDVEHCPGDNLSGQGSAPMGVRQAGLGWTSHPSAQSCAGGSCREHPRPPRGGPGAIGGHRAPSRGQGAPGERSARPRRQRPHRARGGVTTDSRAQANPPVAQTGSTGCSG